MKIFSIILFILIFSFSSLAQNDEWVRLESENKEISFALPKNFSYVFDKKGFSQSNPNNWQDKVDYKNLHSLTSYQNGVTMFFESYDSNQSKRGLPFLLRSYSEGSYQQIKFDKFEGLQIIDEKGAYKTYYYFASEKNTYLIGIGTRDKNNKTINKFLSTIKLNGKNTFKVKDNLLTEPAQTISFKDLKETPVEIEYNLLKKEDLKKTDKSVPMVPPQPNPDALITIFKPRASYTDGARQAGEQGSLRFRIIFQANGQIGKITVVKELKFGLVENAIRAVKRVRFIPAEKEKVPYTVVKQIEYNFVLY